jgi:hypothetical protein
MRPVAIQLDDQPLLAPQAVGLDLEPVDVEESVQRRQWKVSSGE